MGSNRYGAREGKDKEQVSKQTLTGLIGHTGTIELIS